MYTIVFTEDAKKDLKLLSKKAPAAVPKLAKLLIEIAEHPRTGTGKVEILKDMTETFIPGELLRSTELYTV